ncbi:MAG: hypothetical protein IJ234_10895 [Clostridia bacterium]|nr:hypothetical protein [Clostridia bacterium]
MARSKRTRVSVLNWMGTLLLCAIPGVNIIALICFIIFGKAPSKRSFAWAMLLWCIILIAGYVAAALLLPQQMAQLTDWLRTQGSKTVPEAAGPLLAATPAP